MNRETSETGATGWFAHPLTGSTLSVLSGLSFLLVGMLLPMVGPAGAATPHAAQNRGTFANILVGFLLLSGLAVASKLLRRSRDGSPLPVFSIALCATGILLVFALLTGMLRA